MLRYAINSALAQHFEDFELLVIGDACTDDSETVVRSFDDARVRWENLSENAGNQWAPNQRGLELAQGEYVAYLGQDDLWHPEHLGTLVTAIGNQGADLAFTICEELGPAAIPTGWLFGIASPGLSPWSACVPPSSWLHRRELADRIGGWVDYRTTVLPCDIDFFSRAVSSGARIIAVPELTVFKFTSGLRQNSYRQHALVDQAIIWERLHTDPEFRYRELIGILVRLASRHPEIRQRFILPSRVTAGSIIDGYRERRGLSNSLPTAAPIRHTSELHQDRTILGFLNSDPDITPVRYQAMLNQSNELPEDGVFIGFNWHPLESDPSGQRWRWMDTDAQIVITRPSGRFRSLAITLERGPGIQTADAVLQGIRPGGEIQALPLPDHRSTLHYDLPPDAGVGIIFALTTPDGGRLTPRDTRILNVRVFDVEWSELVRPGA